jgi:inorganic pyrophosphatase/exopolyphosphatase
MTSDEILVFDGANYEKKKIFICNCNSTILYRLRRNIEIDIEMKLNSLLRGIIVIDFKIKRSQKLPVGHKVL